MNDIENCPHTERIDRLLNGPLHSLRLRSIAAIAFALLMIAFAIILVWGQ